MLRATWADESGDSREIAARHKGDLVRLCLARPLRSPRSCRRTPGRINGQIGRLLQPLQSYPPKKERKSLLFQTSRRPLALPIPLTLFGVARLPRGLKCLLALSPCLLAVAQLHSRGATAAGEGTKARWSGRSKLLPAAAAALCRPARGRQCFDLACPLSLLCFARVRLHTTACCVQVYASVSIGRLLGRSRTGGRESGGRKEHEREDAAGGSV